MTLVIDSSTFKPDIKLLASTINILLLKVKILSFILMIILGNQ
jgi:hypothetical protein